MKPIDRILLVRLKSMGDILFTLPAVHRLRAAFPQSRLAFLTSREYAPILHGFAAVDTVFTLDRKGPAVRLALAAIGLVRRLRRERFGLSVDFQGYGETGLLTWFTHAPQRWGCVYRPARAWAYTRGVPRDCRLHPAQWNLNLLTQCGVPDAPVRSEFVLPKSDRESARAWLADCACDPATPMLYLQPFTSSAHKNWPLDNYLELARFWRARGVRVIVSGGLADRPALEPARVAGLMLAAGMPMMTDAGLMSLSTLIVGGDTGFVHLAVAMGKRVLMLMKRPGPGSSIPLGHPEWVVAPRGELPIAGIEVEDVIRASVAAF